jgi:hypothetical protein
MPYTACVFCPPPFPRLQVDTQGNLFNIYMEDNKRRITPVGNISDMKEFKVRQGPGCWCYNGQATRPTVGLVSR